MINDYDVARNALHSAKEVRPNQCVKERKKTNRNPIKLQFAISEMWFTFTCSDKMKNVNASNKLELSLIYCCRFDRIFQWLITMPYANFHSFYINHGGFGEVEESNVYRRQLMLSINIMGIVENVVCTRNTHISTISGKRFSHIWIIPKPPPKNDIFISELVVANAYIITTIDC